MADMTLEQELAALRDQCKILEGDRDTFARATLVQKRAEIRRLEARLGQAAPEPPAEVASVRLPTGDTCAHHSCVNPRVPGRLKCEHHLDLNRQATRRGRGQEASPPILNPIQKRRIPDEKRREMFDLRKQGMSGNAIARKLGISQATVSLILRTQRAADGEGGEVRPGLIEPRPDRPVPQGRRMFSTTVYLDPAQFASLRELSERTAVPYAEYVRRGVSLILADPELSPPRLTYSPPAPAPESASPARVSELERALEYVRGLIEGRLPALAKAEMPHTTATLRLALDRISRVLDGS